MLSPVIRMKVKAALAGLARCDCTVPVIEYPKRAFTLVDDDPGSPLPNAFVPINADDTGTIGTALGLVAAVYGLRHFAQVAPAIVKPVAIDVVDGHDWISPGHVNERDVVGAN